MTVRHTTSRISSRGRGFVARRPLITGASATALLALITTGLPLPPAMTVASGLMAMALLVHSWLSLRKRLVELTVWHLYLIALAWGLPLTLARPLFSGDVWSYLAQGLIADAGSDPYRSGPAQALGPDSAVVQHVSHYWLDTPAPYGPAWLELSRLVARITGEEFTLGIILYRLLAVAGVALTAWVLPRLARRAGTAPTTAVWLGLLNPLVLWHLVAGVHNDALMLGLMLVGLEAGLTSLRHSGSSGAVRLVGGAGMLTVAANIKIVAAAAGLTLILELARAGGRPVAQITAVLTVAVAGTLALSALAGFGWVTAVHSGTAVHSWMAPTTAAGLLIGAVTSSGVTATAVSVANLAGALVAFPVVVRLLVAVLRGRRDPVRAAGLIIAATLALGPIVQPWYLLWAILPLAATTHSDRRQRLIVATSAVFAMALPPIGPGVTDLVVGYLVAGFMVAGVFLRHLAHCAGQATPRLRSNSDAASLGIPERRRPARDRISS